MSFICFLETFTASNNNAVYKYKTNTTLKALKLLNFKVTQNNMWIQFVFASSLAPALIRQASYGTIKIGMYRHLKRAVSGGSEGTVLPSFVTLYNTIVMLL